MAEQAKDVFVFYSEYVKPLYCEIEALDNTVPVEMLFEIHAAFDHLRRFFINSDDEATSSRRAIGHLKRAALDALKLKLKFFNKDVESLLNRGPCLHLVDNGQFLPTVQSDKREIIKFAKQARIQESNNDPDQAFDLWFKTSLLINEFYDKHLSDQTKVVIAENNVKKWLSKDKRDGVIIGVIIGLSTGIISSLVVWWITTDSKAIAFFSAFFAKTKNLVSQVFNF